MDVLMLVVDSIHNYLLPPQIVGVVVEMHVLQFL